MPEDDSDQRFEVLSVGEMRRRYGLTAENVPAVDFSPDDVPARLRDLVPLAKKWGINDDLIREDLVARAAPEDRRELKAAVSAVEDELDDWLAGPEGSGPPTDAYLAFTAMRLAADDV